MFPPWCQKESAASKDQEYNKKDNLVFNLSQSTASPTPGMVTHFQEK